MTRIGREFSHLKYDLGEVWDMRQIDNPITASNVWWALIAITVLLLIAYVITFPVAIVGWLRGR